MEDDDDDDDELASCLGDWWKGLFGVCDLSGIKCLLVRGLKFCSVYTYDDYENDNDKRSYDGRQD